MKCLVLDDDAMRHRLFGRNFTAHEMTYVFTAEAAIEALQQNTYDAIFLDHDLGDRVYVDSHGPEKTGYTVAKWIAEHPNRKPAQIYVHSLNPVGASNIQAVLPDAILAPGLWTVQQ